MKCVGEGAVQSKKIWKKLSNKLHEAIICLWKHDIRIVTRQLKDIAI